MAAFVVFCVAAPMATTYRFPLYGAFGGLMLLLTALTFRMAAKDPAGRLLAAILALVYFYAHYFFASTTAHVTAMFAAFFAAGVALGVPPMLLGLLLAFSSSLNMSLTHYATGTAPIIFSSGYATLNEWYAAGAVMSVVNLAVLAGAAEADLRLGVDVDGQVMQDGTTRTMIFPVTKLVSYVSHFISLNPGDIIATGALLSAGAGASAAGGAAGTAISSEPLPLRVPRPSDGAISAFSTLSEPQDGQVTSPRFDCLS